MIHNIENPLLENQVKSYMQMLLKGVAYLHGQNIMHRDLKPANLLLRYVQVQIAIETFDTKDSLVDIHFAPGQLAPGHYTCTGENLG